MLIYDILIIAIMWPKDYLYIYPNQFRTLCHPDHFLKHDRNRGAILVSTFLIPMKKPRDVANPHWLYGAMRDDPYKAGKKPDREAEVKGGCILCPLPTPKGEGERELRVRGEERLRLMIIRLRYMTAILP